MRVLLNTILFSLNNRKELREYKDYMDRQAEEKANFEKYRKLEEEAKRNHFLISTKQIPGVYNSPYQP